MERSRLLQCLAADYMRLRDMAGTGLSAKVPTCAPWTVGDLVRHVGQVYLHKAELMRTGSWPAPWPPDEILTEPPVALLDRGYGALTHEFSRRHDDDRALTFYPPDQTVKFWIRRMALETVIHRLDAEFAHKVIDPAPIPEDLAATGVEEVLEIFVGYGPELFGDDFAPALQRAKGHAVEVRLLSSGASGSGSLVGSASGSAGSPGGGSRAAGGSPAAGGPLAAGGSVPGASIARSWLVRAVGDRVHVSARDGSPIDAPPSATVTASPVPMLRWLWSRESTPTTDAHSPIAVEGDGEAIAELRSLLRAATQ